KQKVWAFGYWESFRKSLGSSTEARVPTAAELQGNLSDFQPIYNPFTTQQVGTDAQGNPIFARTPFLNNQISAALLNPAAEFLANTYPKPNLPTNGTQPNFINTEPVVTDSDQFGIRVDAALSDKTSFFGRFSNDHAKRLLPQTVPNYPDTQSQIGVQQ